MLIVPWDPNRVTDSKVDYPGSLAQVVATAKAIRANPREQAIIHRANANHNPATLRSLLRLIMLWEGRQTEDRELRRYRAVMLFIERAEVSEKAKAEYRRFFFTDEELAEADDADAFLAGLDPRALVDDTE